MSSNSTRSIAVYYEHPEWFRPLFSALERRGLAYEPLHSDTLLYDPADPAPPYSLVFNRMSPSAHLRGRPYSVAQALNYLSHLERLGVRVINGYQSFVCETSKAFQLSLLSRLGLPYPRARVISRAEEALAAAEGLRFPVVIKPNVGGSGAGIRRFETQAELRDAADGGELDLGIDRTALVQEYIPAADDHIVRVEVVGKHYLYAIRVHTTGESFNLCPADLCQPGVAPIRRRDAVRCSDADVGLGVETYQPPAEVISAVQRILTAAAIEVGGVEYLIDSRDGRIYFYDINATSNFVADAQRVVGFDPFEPLIDYIEREAAAPVLVA